MRTRALVDRLLPPLLVMLLAAAAGAAEPERRIEADGYVFTITPAAAAGPRISVVEKRHSKVVYSATILDANYKHYHPLEYRNGRLYVIQRTGGPDGYRTFPDSWTDELWRYEGSRGVKLFATRGLDFRVPPGEGFVAVRDGSPQFPDGGHLLAARRSEPGTLPISAWTTSGRSGRRTASSLLAQAARERDWTGW